MIRSTFMARAAARLAPLGLAASALAANPYYDLTINGINLRLGFPPGVKVVKAALVNPAGGVGDGQFTWVDWPVASIGIDRPDGSNRGTRIKDALVAAMPQFAKASGHPELDSIPFLFWGLSAGGGWSVEIASYIPDRTIAVGAVEPGGWPDTTKHVLYSLPQYFIFSENSDFPQYKTIGTAWPPMRRQGAPWGIGVQWGQPHNWVTANLVLCPYFDRILDMRIPAGADPLKGKITLKPLAESDGWVGIITDWDTKVPTIMPAKDFTGDKGNTAWLPDAYQARLWRAYAAKVKAVSLTCSAGGNDFGNQVPYGTVLSFNATPPAGATKVSLYDGDQLIAEKTGAPYVFGGVKLGEGHARGVFAEATMADGSLAVSKPVLLFVRNKPDSASTALLAAPHRAMVPGGRMAPVNGGAGLGFRAPDGAWYSALGLPVPAPVR